MQLLLKQKKIEEPNYRFLSQAERKEHDAVEARTLKLASSFHGRALTADDFVNKVHRMYYSDNREAMTGMRISGIYQDTLNGGWMAFSGPIKSIKHHNPGATHLTSQYSISINTEYGVLNIPLGNLQKLFLESLN